MAMIQIILVLHVHLLLTFGAVTIEIDKAEDDDNREMAFSHRASHRLVSPVDLKNVTMKTMNVVNKMHCAFACVKENWCFSANFEVAPGSRNLHKCELLSIDGGNYPDALNKDEGYVYLSSKILEDPCKKNPCLNGGVCKVLNNRQDYRCQCKIGYDGEKCQNVYRDCSELLSAGYTADGVYPVDPDGNGSFPVYCDMTSDGGGWTVFQRNRNDSPISFHRGWQDYKTGFGDQTVEFWLGLEKIYRLTKRQVTTLRVDVEDLSGNKGYSVYSSFSITDERDFYRLTVSGYSGSAGDSISNATNADWINNNMRFSTPDKDNDNYRSGNCADKGGWWYKWCTNSDLNGEKTWWTFSKTLNNTEMKLK